MDDNETPSNHEFWLRTAEKWEQTAELFEKHQKLGHLRKVDGYEIARDLRERAQKVRAKYK
jgi:hypothetical protein